MLEPGKGKHVKETQIVTSVTCRKRVQGILDTDVNQGVFALRRSVGDRVEFLFLSFWDSIAAVRRFAGEDYGRAVFYPEDDRYLIDRDLHVDHYEVVARTGAVPGDAIGTVVPVLTDHRRSNRFAPAWESCDAASGWIRCNDAQTLGTVKERMFGRQEGDVD